MLYTKNLKSFLQSIARAVLAIFNAIYTLTNKLIISSLNGFSNKFCSHSYDLVSEKSKWLNAKFRQLISVRFLYLIQWAYKKSALSTYYWTVFSMENTRNYKKNPNYLNLSSVKWTNATIKLLLCCFFNFNNELLLFLIMRQSILILLYCLMYIQTHNKKIK